MWNYLFATFWTIMLITLFFGYEPHVIVVGCAFFNTAILLLENERYRKGYY